jgi:hypothetical protein
MQTRSSFPPFLVSHLSSIRSTKENELQVLVEKELLSEAPFEISKILKYPYMTGLRPCKVSPLAITSERGKCPIIITIYWLSIINC